ncbi:long-chain fatty acid--CoA ligase [Streptomyces sp. A7024]|uniref:Long-chain fatty acid--CoA ligase n=1 Tax=Streptomyces coryli TaxID=1128680 RepID=A0A6G4TTJ6_9ACTN|nr:AMP-binding protein [Streptomyces coryli]NGN63133.1 long-chain fatty acid--CoA ligase [Streptomyces coryli]
MAQEQSRNLARLAEAAFQRLGDHESLVYEGKAYRSGELFERGRRVAGGLGEIGVRPGDRIVVLMANCPEVPVTYHAIWRAGAVVTPVIFLVSPAELAHILTDSRAEVIVTSPELLGTVAGAAAQAPGLRRVVVAGEWPPDALPETVDVTSYEELEAAAPVGIAPRGDDEPAALLYTGGTTGRAKGVVLTHRNLHACSLATHEASDVEDSTRTLVPLPLSHAYGLIVTLTGWHSTKPGLGVLQRWFTPQEWLELAAKHGVHRTTLVPSMIRMLLDLPLEDADLSQLRYVNSGAAPLPPDTRAEWERRVPSSRILEGYGCTESGSVVSATHPDAIRPGSVGRALPGYEVEIRDDDGELPVPAGTDGEIWVRSAGVMAGYWNAPVLTSETLRDGWLRTGDMGRVDADGYLYVVDRKKDLILRGGFNVYPRDVEDVLVTHPDVAAAGVVGRPDGRLGEEVVAYVALHPESKLTGAELVAYARGKLAAHKYPRDVHILGGLPLTSVGKLDRKALRTLAAG